MKKLKNPELFIDEHRGSTLGKIHEEERKKENPLGVLLLVVLIFFGVFIGVGAGWYCLAKNDVEVTDTSPLSEEVVITTTTTNTTTTTTALTTTSTTTTTTSTTTPTTTTLNCGDDWEPPCENESGQECDPGNVIGSEGLCHVLECAPSVPSGKGGCGAWALRDCQ